MTTNFYQSLPMVVPGMKRLSWNHHLGFIPDWSPHNLLVTTAYITPPNDLALTGTAATAQTFEHLFLDYAGQTESRSGDSNDAIRST